MSSWNGRDITFLRLCLFISAVLILCCSLPAQKRGNDVPMPTEFEIGRLTYFDFGPPNDYYELLLVRPEGDGTAVERITLTPYASCLAPAKVEIAHGLLIEPVATLLANTNPCTIPEKDLRRELKRCKDCVTFSGVNVVMQVPCGNQTRVIRADILDKDLFDANPKTPERTSWTVNLLSKLDQALGPGVMDKPMIDIPKQDQPPPDTSSNSHSAILQELAAGKYDPLFSSGPDKPSELYREAHSALVSPTVDLVTSRPFMPDVFAMPVYPPIARLAGIEGVVSFTAQIDQQGIPMNLNFETEAPLFLGVIKAAVGKWRFPKEAVGQEVHVELRFTSNCPKKTN
jgi:hypothetical protein